MLLTITNTKSPATDLGCLLHKNPSRVQSFELSFGKAHVFYPETSTDRCTAALLLDVDPVGLVRTRRGPSGEGGMLDQYVNDRPYVASSFMSVAIARVFNSALAGNSKDRPELVAVPLPLVARIAVVPCRGGKEFLRRLFEPLGYQVIAEHHPLDEKFPEWGEGPYYTVEISKSVTLQDLLTHLYVLIPVLDADKHYWVGKDEIEKLLRHGEGWLQSTVHSLTDLKLAPFHLLASEGAVHSDKDHVWHMSTLARLCASDSGLLLATPYKVVDAGDEASQKEGIDWWEELTASGGEGMVVKPLQFVTKSRRGLVQPAVKCRGREYLRIIYGPEYTAPEHLERLRSRGLGTKRSLALREFAIGMEGLQRFAEREPLRRVHECVFGVLALESEPVDPRL